MRKSSGEPKSIEAEIESSNSEEREETEGSDVSQADEPLQDAATNAEAALSDDWWSASQPAADWGNLPRPILPRMSLALRSRAQLMSISAATRVSFH